MEWYEQQFRLKPEHSAVGEATPVYMYDAQVRARIADELDDIKIIVIVRDPVARAYSHFWHSRRYERETLDSFEEALAEEPRRLEQIQAQVLAEGWTHSRVRPRYWWSYVDRGRYIDQFLDLEDRYGRDRICVLTLEQTKREPKEQLAVALNHIGVDPDLHPGLNLPQKNAYSNLSPRKIRRLTQAGEEVPEKETGITYPPLAPLTREKLMKEFADYDLRLKQWLGWKQLPWDSLANE